MKSVGEAMAIGRTFKEACKRRCAVWRSNASASSAMDGKDVEVDDETLTTKLTVPTRSASSSSARPSAKGWDVEKVFELTKIDPWFLRQIEEIVKEQAHRSLRQRECPAARLIKSTRMGSIAGWSLNPNGILHLVPIKKLG